VNANQLAKDADRILGSARNMERDIDWDVRKDKKRKQEQKL